jgi:hypothetical protein
VQPLKRSKRTHNGECCSTRIPMFIVRIASPLIYMHDITLLHQRLYVYLLSVYLCWQRNRAQFTQFTMRSQLSLPITITTISPWISILSSSRYTSCVAALGDKYPVHQKYTIHRAPCVHSSITATQCCCCCVCVNL